MIARLAFLAAGIGCFVWTSCNPPCARAQGRQALDAARNLMVDEEIVAAGVKDPRVIEAMRNTIRHEFVPLAQRRYAYYDMGLAIGHGQTISAPFVVAYMTEQLEPQPSDKVLEIGTGSGYQAAVLSGLVKDVYTIEIVEPLGRKAAYTLRRLRYDNVHAKTGDGYQGWPEHAPFDKIIVTCSPESIPRALVDQLREGGRMVIPVGKRYHQNIYVLEKTDGKMAQLAALPVLFVPMTGEAERQRQVKPDPANPTIYNGDFELLIDDTEKPDGWHSQRQLKLEKGTGAPSGSNYVTFTNADPGRGCRALQGIPVDGRQIKQLRVSVDVRGADIRPGETGDQLPGLIIAFFDDDRQRVADGYIGPWSGTFDWRRQTALLNVPVQAREAIVRIGLLGAVGEISFDAIEIEPIQR